MIKYFKNSEIDREKWDACIRLINDGMPYAFSWYLDFMSPGWDALVEDDYHTVFPLPVFKKFRFNYIATPIFLQQLGAFSQNTNRDQIAKEFLSLIPKSFRLIDLCIGQNVELESFKSLPKDNFEMKLSDSYEILSFDYSAHCRRNINIAHRYRQDIVSDVKPEELISLFKNNTMGKIGGIKNKNFVHLTELMKFTINNGLGKILGVRSPKGKLLWGIFYIDVCNRITLIFNAGSRKSRELRTAYYVTDYIIKTNAQSNKILDFEGSSIPSVAAFMKSFGSIRKTYYHLYSNKLPWPIRFLK
jgi:hypothetical protein